MQQPCLKCGLLTDYSGDLHCRKILIGEVKNLLSLGKNKEAKNIVIDSQGEKGWEDWKMETFDRIYLQYKKEIERLEFEENKRIENEKKVKLAEIFSTAQLLLNDNKFFEADQFVLEKNSDELLNEYEKEKTKYIQKDFRDLENELKRRDPNKYANVHFDNEKSSVLSAVNRNILVQARAGSGKTTAIALKVRQLIKYYGIKPKEILVLAFNEKASEEFRDRIKDYCGDGIATESNTLTFHALARRIANTDKNILIDEKINKSKNENKYSRHGKDDKPQIDFIQECFSDVEEKERNLIEELFYKFLKITSEKVAGVFRNNNDYYNYLINLEYTTISGETVKSKGEKYIADFLFEHNIFKNGKEICYAYEHNVKKILNTGYPYSPDFSLFYTDDKNKEQLQAVIEYFGFTENNTGYPGFFETKKKSRDYLNETVSKRILLKDLNFVEMSQDDFDKIMIRDNKEESIRFAFDEIIRKRLSNYGFIISDKLSLKEILAKIPKVERRKQKLVKQIMQFINKAQKLSYLPDKIREIAENEKTAHNLTLRNEYFIKIAIKVYDEYKNKMKVKNYTDFDGLFIDAIEKLIEDREKSKIIPTFGNEEIEIGRIKYILIDEYQDFSELFYTLIDKIRETNRSIGFFCVGDNWQAINGFAGSNLKYFDDFEKEYFKGGRRIPLLTNYRSYKKIIDHSNLLMSGRGLGGKSLKDNFDGSVYLSRLQRVELRVGQEYLTQFNKDEKFRTISRELVGIENINKKTPLEISRCLKTISSIISKKPGKKICLLFRTNKLYGVGISKFTDEIRKLRFPSKWEIEYKEEHKSKIETGYINGIIFSTVHKFKGKEGNIVIIVDANRRSFPKFHPDNELMEILGVTIPKVLEEERRLFYVAITRAKEELYLLYEEEKGCSDFISEIKTTGWQYLSVDDK